MTARVEIGGATRLFAIVGDPVVQVKAPTRFNALFRARGIDAVMLPFHVAEGDLDAAMAGFRSLRNLDGVIVTVPYKFAFAALMDTLADTGRHVGAVNAMRREPDGRWTGDMFDGRGFVAGLVAEGHDPRGRSTLLIGAGGVGHAIAFALIDGGVGRLVLHDRVAERARALAARLGTFHADHPVTVGPPDPAGVDLVINATPMGMAPEDPLPVDAARLEPGCVVAEVVMEPARTRLLVAAAARGCAVQPGHFLLDHMVDAIATFFRLDA